MTYVYDLILNFNPILYEFYEWNRNDQIYHIKRINIIKISSTSYDELLSNDIKISDEFLFSIFNKCEYFENRNVKNLSYAFLVSDKYRVMGLMVDMNGNIIKYSSLLLDEEEDVLDIVGKLAITKMNYLRLSRKREPNNLTRMENHILEYLKNDFNKSFQEKDISKLKYIYYEYFNKQNKDINKIYFSLIKELNHVNEKHFKIYQLIKLSYSHKGV